MAARFILPIQQVFSNLGSIGIGYKLKTYQTLTVTPLATYSDEDLVTPNANPATGATTGNQIADENGRFGDIWMGNEQDYKVVLTDENDVEIFTADPVNGGASSSLTSFDPMPEAFWGTTSGTSTHYTLASNVDISQVGYQNTQIFELDFHTSCAASPDIAIDGLSALNLKKQTGQGTKVALLAGDVYGTHLARNDGTDIIILNPRTKIQYLGAPPTLTVATNTLTLTNVGSSYNINTGSGAQTINTISGLVSGQIATIGISSNSNAATIATGAGNIINPYGISSVLNSVNDKLTVYNDGTNNIIISSGINKNFLSSKAASGYTYLPNGVVLQWGTGTTNGTTGVTVTYPIQFPTAVTSFVFEVVATGGGAGDVTKSIGTPSTTSTVAYARTIGGAAVNNTFFWHATGY